MITDLWIENFKGIGKRQHIPLRPITLLFGANSAGKSTVLHALLYLREIIENRNCDPINPIGGEQTLSLGGFANMLHRSPDKPSENISLGIRFAVGDDQRSSFTDSLHEDFSYMAWIPDCPEKRDWIIDLFPRPPRFIEFNLSIGQRTPRTSPTVSSLRISADEEPFLNLHLMDSGLANGWINLMSECWACPAVPQPNNSTVRALYRKCYQLRSYALRQALLEKNAADKVTGEETPSTEFVSSLIECPRFDTLHSNFLELVNDSVLWLDQRITVISWTEFLKMIRPDTSANEIDVLLESINEDSVYALITNELMEWLQSSSSPSIENCNNLEVRIPPVGLIANNVSLPTLSKVVGVIRDYWTAAFAFPGGGEVGSEFQGQWTHQFEIGLRGSALPMLNQLFVPKPTGAIVPSMYYGERGDITNDYPDIIDATVTSMIRAFMSWLASELAEITYVGPKRSAVPRHLSNRTVAEFSEWGSGLAAWRWLIETDDKVFQECSDWLARLGESQGNLAKSGYQLFRERFVEVTLETPDRQRNVQSTLDVNNLQPHTRLFLLDRASMQRLHPQDVGEGITQVVPVIAALVRASRDLTKTEGLLVAIEQPELHLHPSLAAKLGDLVLATMIGTQGRQCLIETHSEHLILRILRRIRQTTDGELPEHIPPVKPDDVCVLWVDNLGDGTTITRLRIDGNGEFIDRWPHGFFREREEDLFG